MPSGSFSILVLLVLFHGTITTALTVLPPTQPSPLTYHPQTFSPEETSRIITQFTTTLSSTHDHRQDQAVKRTNYFDQGTTVSSPDSPYKWIFEKVVAKLFPSEKIQDFQNRIDFVLMHQFDASGFFDWHVDCHPYDGTNRTMNVNVMLTDKSQYEGGALIVGKETLHPENGDLYMYPATYPHKVADIVDGRRFTLVIAMKESPLPSNYWSVAEKYFQELCHDSQEAKLHMLYGQFLIDMKRSSEEIDAKFADSYARTPEALQYAEHFEKEGMEHERQGRVQAAMGSRNMARLILDRVEKLEQMQKQREL